MKAVFAFSMPRTLSWSSPPVDFTQPKISSIRLRMHWLIA
jgi:hypothetical protein